MATQARGDTLVKGGLVVTGQGMQRADVLIAGDTVQQVAPDIPAQRAARVIDASGKLVLPGVVDAHSHPVYADKMDQFTISCAFGGITTTIPFVGNVRGWGFSGPTSEVIKGFIEDSEKRSYLDFAVHGTFMSGDDIDHELPQMTELGVISSKIFMAYGKRGMMMPDEKLLRLMALSKDLGTLTMVHAENGHAIDYLVDRFVAEGKTGNEWFLPSQPNIVEAEAVFRSSTYGEVTGCPVYVVHMSAREGPEVMQFFRRRGDRVFAETCPQYLSLTNAETLKHGATAKIAPPLREREDLEAMWRALADGTLCIVASDSCNYAVAQKWAKLSPGPVEGAPKAANIFEGRFGAPWAEQMLPVVYHLGINTGRITLPRLVQVLCENPARMFGIYPRKGTVQPGSDADLVVFDPAVRHTLSAKTHHSNSDFTLYEGWEVLGKPTLVMQRGRVLVDGDTFLGQQGKARFIPGKREAAAYNPGGHQVL